VVGRLLTFVHLAAASSSVLQSRGWWDETLWVVSSDNGAPLDLTEGAGSNEPLKGGKYSVSEDAEL
jgi:hypothetical protein